MRVSIIKNKKIQNIILPEVKEGNYWISDVDNNGINRNLISIEVENDKWKLISNNEVFCVVGEQEQAYVYLEEYNFYTIKNSVENSVVLLYCSPVRTEYNYYDFSELVNNDVIIGNSEKSIIKVPFLNTDVALIKKEDNKIFISSISPDVAVYVNCERLLKKKEIKIGDVIFINGLKIVYMVAIRENFTTSLCFWINSISGLVVSANAYTYPVSNVTPVTEELEDEIEYPLYDEKEYYHKTPRFISRIVPLELSIDAPPVKTEEQETSALLTIGPMLTMSMMSLMTGYTALNNVMNGTATLENSLPSLVISGAMLTSVIIWPILTKRFEKNRRIKAEKKRQEKYSEYIESKKKMIHSAILEQTKILVNNYPHLEEIKNIILNRQVSLWQRRIKDADFLEINLGLGSYPMKIDIKYPEEHFSMAEDNLKDMVSTLGSEPKLLSNVPVVLSLINSYVAGLIGNDQETIEYFKRLALQLFAFHSYDDLKIIVLTDSENEYKWKFLRNLPHCFTDDKSLRFFATNNNEYKEVCYYLEKEYTKRKESKNSGNIKVEDLNKVYLIVTDSFKKIRDFDVINNILNSKSYLGFGLFILGNKITNLPDQCMSFIELVAEKGRVHNNENFNDAIDFNVDLISNLDYELCVKRLANIPIELKDNSEGQLPSKIGFLEMYDVGKIEQLNAGARWSQNNPVLNLHVPVGIGKNGELISIDLHEKYHGPHGLIAGMTGSGKSEFIISYILSAAINYHPDEVQFVLIDYKGGGLAGAFENETINLKLPHLVGTITNLDANEIKRSLASIESELKRRQSLFNRAREISGDSTIDIYKYQKMYREKTIDEPISHLFIISDEFAELKNQQPEFMEQLISTARIGRSLGVHLILATQKPSGVVDPQIWSNTRFRVCMRVQDKSDSNEVIKCPDAAFLKQTGRFYFQVGFNEVFILGQASWAGGKYLPAEKVNKSIDTTINFVNNIGYSVKDVDTKLKKEVVSESNGEELLNIVKYLDDLAKQNDILCKPLWLSKIPEYIVVENLATKYNYVKENYTINPIVGEYDIPGRQEQKLLTLPLSKEGNATVFGSSGSGKENFITSTIYSSMIYYSPEELNFYIIDFGSGALKMFDNCPLVGDIITADEERKKMFANYNGDYDSYCRNSGNVVPAIVVVINNYEAYQETFSKYDDNLIILSRDCTKYGIFFILSLNTPTGIRFKLRQNFALTYCLQQNQDEDFITILGSINKSYPAKLFGRGIIKNDEVYEFQTASICEPDNLISHVKKQNDFYHEKYGSKAKSVPVLPSVVTYSDVKEAFGQTHELVIGIQKDNLEIVKYDFIKSYATIITSIELAWMSNIVNMLINQIIAINKENVIVINADDLSIDERYKNKYQYIDNKYDDFISSLSDFCKEKKEIYETNNYDVKVFNNTRKVNCFIIGFDSLRNKLSSDNKNKLTEIIDNLKNLEIVNFYLIDTIDKIEKVELESWFKNSVNNTNGIWIGSGINDQFSLKISRKIDEMKYDVPNDFCFIIKHGKPQYVKYIEKLELNFSKENNNE